MMCGQVTAGDGMSVWRGTMRRGALALVLAWATQTPGAMAQVEPEEDAPEVSVPAPAPRKPQPPQRAPVPRPAPPKPLAVKPAVPAAVVAGPTSPIDTGESAKAQMEMLTRIEDAVRRYATQIGLDDSYVQYCRMELRIRLQEQVKSGNPIFNFSPERIRSTEALKAVIAIRETYERTFLNVCLAQAKSAMTAAGGLPLP
jgi:hypothetical protein